MERKKQLYNKYVSYHEAANYIYDRLAFGVGFVIYFLTAVKYDFRPSLLCAVCVYTCALLREGNPDIHLAL
jgi:hypothetical protein